MRRSDLRARSVSAAMTAITGVTALLLAGVPCAQGAARSAEPAAAEQTASAGSQDARIAELERRVAELEAALKKALDSGSTAELERRLDLVTRELEKLKLGEASAPRALEPMHGLGPAASKVYGVEGGVSIGGYGESLYEDFAARRDDGTRTGGTSVADLLRAVLYFGYKFNDRIVFNSELEFEHATTGEGAEQRGEASVEFANLDFLLSKPANIRAGLVLIPVGFINELHEPPTFLGARRPDVETLVIPATWRELGVGVFGDAGSFSYRAYLVDGFDAKGFSPDEGLREGRQGGSQASARDLGFVARGDFHGLPGLLAGASFYAGDSGQGAETAAGRVIDGRVTLYDIHAEYGFKGFQFRGLWTVASVDDAGAISRDILGLDPADPNMATSSVGSRITGWYLQAAYDALSWMGERSRQSVTPFIRYERFDTQDRVPAGFLTDGGNDVRVMTYGVAYKPISSITIKVDLQNYTRGDGSGTDQINAALGYIF
jgi:hypothetical protein